MANRLVSPAPAWARKWHFAHISCLKETSPGAFDCCSDATRVKHFLVLLSTYSGVSFKLFYSTHTTGTNYSNIPYAYP